MSKTALVLQGGGLRGVYTSGVLDILIENGIEFDAVYGISAGAKNSQYYISKQPGEAIKVDLFCIKDKRAISLKNFILDGGYISQKFYNEYIMTEYAPLNLEVFNSSKQKFYMGATNCLTGEIKYFEKSTDNVRDAVTASCSLPLVQSMKYINNIPYLDGGIAESISVRQAIEDGYDKILVVLTRERGYRAENISHYLKRLLQVRYRKYPKLVEKLVTQNDRHNVLLSKIEELEQEGKIYCIYPSEPPTIKVLEKDEEKIKNLYALGRSDMTNHLKELQEYIEK